MSLSFYYPDYLWISLILPFLAAIALASPLRRNPGRFYSSLAIRMLIFLALILSLAGAQLNIRSDLLTTVFVLDASDSVSPEQRQKGEAILREAISNKPEGDQAALIVFGEEALVERLSSDDPILAEITSIPVSEHTNIAGALQIAQAIFPGEGARRIVLLSDGRENLGQAIDQAELAAAAGIELSYIPLGSAPSGAEVWIDSFHAPNEVRLGQDFDLKVVIESSAALEATLRVFEEGALVKSIEIRLLPGSNRVTIPMNAATSQLDDVGLFRRFHVQVIPAADTRLQNNSASAYTIVQGPPSILVVEGGPGDGRNFAEALQAASMNVSLSTPAEMPSSLNELVNYEGVVLVNVPAAALPTGVMDILQVYVRDLGKGLVMVGGPGSFGSGGYLRTPLEEILPVDMDVRDKTIQSNLALVLAVDKSGSMGRCHCDNPDLNQTYTPNQSGQPKVDIAKEAVMRAASAIGKDDYLGVVAFDSQPRWAVELAQLPDPLSLERSISAIQAEGGTNLEAGVKEAYLALQDVQARRKHIILMTDGWVRTGELNNLAQEMASQGITFSIVAAGEGSAEYLHALASLGGGEFYPATNIQEVPEIFLKETMKSVGKYIVEEAFYPISASPSPILRGIDAGGLPPLLGYNGVSAKKTARLDLITPKGDPLLASWQHGLGRTAVWTSDFRGQWAIEWLEWDGFAPFAAQLVSWTLPSPRAEGLEIQASHQENQAIISMRAAHKDGSPYNSLTGMVTLIDPSLEVREISMKQIGAGQYQASADASSPGVYLLRVGVNDGDQSLGQSTTGLVVPFSPEYKTSGVDFSFLSRLAGSTGGGEINPEDPAIIFAHNLDSIPSATQIWLPLLVLAALLFPLDVALRRLSVRKKDLSKAAAWVQSRRHRSTTRDLEPRPRLLEGLFEARQRARHHIDRQDHSFSSEPNPLNKSVGNIPSKSVNPDESRESLIEPDHLPSGEDETLNRLKAAKKRLRR